MDTLSHGLYGGVAFGRNSRRSYWIAFLAGVLPDILVFGPTFLRRIFGNRVIIEPPDPSTIPAYLYEGYNITHSLVVFTVVFGIIWFIRHRPMWELGGWGLHILIDIPTHATRFFPTPYLWPFPHPKVDGHSWFSPEIFIPNVLLLIILYAIWFWKSRKKPRVSL